MKKTKRVVVALILVFVFAAGMVLNTAAAEKVVDLGSFIKDTKNWTVINIEPKDVFVNGKLEMSKDYLVGYKGKKFADELITFKAKVKADPTDGWLSIMLRSSGINAMWGVDKTYCILIRKEGEYELQKWIGGKPEVLASGKNKALADGKDHMIKCQTVNTKDGVKVNFFVDGKSAISFTDKKNPIKDPGYFSMFVYGYTKATLSPTK